MVERLTVGIDDAILNSPSAGDLRNLVANAFDQELLRELRSHRTSVTSTVVDMALNFVPFGSLASTAKGLSALGRDKTSWISLL
jgi:hypothetical protein